MLKELEVAVIEKWNYVGPDFIRGKSHVVIKTTSLSVVISVRCSDVLKEMGDDETEQFRLINVSSRSSSDTNEINGRTMRARDDDVETVDSS
ncbi:hypothetical protein QE152_g10898 [Popillia japonica]|uniref:Uncharacterized protein n=1 Tax=Popillia japonica TaxID=7064 RepID=A0AAW1LU70_POPJA